MVDPDAKCWLRGDCITVALLEKFELLVCNPAITVVGMPNG